MDLENGPGAFLAPNLDFPSPMAIGAAHLDDPGKTLAGVRAMGRATARYGRAAGCAWTLGPVVDLNLHPDNPIVQTRSFGGDPETQRSVVRVWFGEQTARSRSPVRLSS